MSDVRAGQHVCRARLDAEPNYDLFTIYLTCDRHWLWRGEVGVNPPMSQAREVWLTHITDPEARKPIVPEPPAPDPDEHLIGEMEKP